MAAIVTASYHLSTTASYSPVAGQWAVANKTSNFGTRLWAEAKAKGAPQSQVGLSEWFKNEHGIKVSGPMLSKYRNHDELPRMSKCRDFAVALGVNVEWLLSGRGTKRPSDIPLNEYERRLLGMWRRLDEERQKDVFQRMQYHRLTPDMPVPSPDTSIEQMILNAVNEDGEDYT